MLSYSNQQTVCRQKLIRDGNLLTKFSVIRIVLITNDFSIKRISFYWFAPRFANQIFELLAPVIAKTIGD
jgi:hypothetical protein